MSQRRRTPSDAEARLRQLEQLAREHGWAVGMATEPRPLASRRRLPSALVALVLVLALPMVALASDTFSDVPNTNVFHNNINNLFRSRVTTGCGGGNFCPENPVTREQMAAFLNRGLGRAGSVSANLATASQTRTVLELDSFTVKTGDVVGGTVFLVITGHTTASTQANGVCPCGLSIWPEVDGVAVVGVQAHDTIADAPAPLFGAGAWRAGSAAFTTVVPVSSGVSHTVSLNMDLNRQSAAIMGASYQLTAYYVPFGPGGTSQPAPSIARHAAPGPDVLPTRD